MKTSNNPFFLPADQDALFERLKSTGQPPHGDRMGGLPPLAGEDAGTAWRNAVPETERRMLYVHIPFCLSRCYFCGFYANRTDKAELAGYTELLLKELYRSAAEDSCAQGPIDVVYFGGGTPTDLSAADLRRLIRCIYDCFQLADDVEFTVEGRLFGFDDEKVAACVDAGATRFSFGVQAFETELRRRMGRRLSREEVIDRLTCIKELCGARAAVIIDLIYGLPGQTQDDWMENVRTAAEDLPLDGADFYLLKMLPDTPLSKQFSNVAPWSDPELLNRYVHACRFLKNKRWTRLSISHWGRTPLERNRYNHWTKSGTDLLPYGCGAGGSIGDWSFMQVRDLDQYRAAVDAGRKPLGMAIKKPAHRHFQSRISDQMERGFLDPVTFSGIDLAALIENWIAAGIWMRNDEGICRLTSLGEFYQPRLAGMLTGFCAMSTMMSPR